MKPSTIDRVNELRKHLQNAPGQPGTLEAKVAAVGSAKRAGSDLNYWQANNDIGVGTEEPWETHEKSSD